MLTTSTVRTTEWAVLATAAARRRGSSRGNRSINIHDSRCTAVTIPHNRRRSLPLPLPLPLPRRIALRLERRRPEAGSTLGRRHCPASPG